MDHLLPEFQEIAKKTDAERIQFIDSRLWISYPFANQALEIFEDYRHRPKINRMPNLYLEGDSNNGKSEILFEYSERFQPQLVTGQGTKLDVFMVQAPPKSDESKMYDHLLKKLNVPINTNERTQKKFYRLENVLTSLELKILIIDEIHNVITGTYNRQRDFMTVLKFLANELKIILIVAGTKDARRVINTDDQLANRFHPMIIPKWKLDEVYINLLISFEKRIPLREKSNLAERELGLKIFNLSEGLLGEISWIIKESARQAIRLKKEKITERIIDDLPYLPPSQRKVK